MPPLLYDSDIQLADPIQSKYFHIKFFHYIKFVFVFADYLLILVGPSLFDMYTIETFDENSEALKWKGLSLYSNFSNYL
jgi:hypothetical protein